MTTLSTSLHMCAAIAVVYALFVICWDRPWGTGRWGGPLSIIISAIVFEVVAIIIRLHT